MKISIINGDGTTTYVENMTPVTSLEEFSDSLTSATQALNDSQTETNATFAGTSLTVPTDLMSIFEEAADTYGVDVNLLTAIAKQESNFTADATSSSGAMGIMQLTKSARAKRFSEILPMLPSFIFVPNIADSTAPIWDLPSPPLPLITIMRCPLLEGIRQ